MLIHITGLAVVIAQVRRSDAADVGTGNFGFGSKPVEYVPADTLGGEMGFTVVGTHR